MCVCVCVCDGICGTQSNNNDKEKSSSKEAWVGGREQGAGRRGRNFCLIIKQYVQMSADSRCKYVLEIGCQHEKFTISFEALLCGLFSDATPSRYRKRRYINHTKTVYHKPHQSISNF